ncbi:MAG: ABC transporter substrate-binding protein [Candidatus Rokubacteria bacterium]|nr:ABC transporter substrate-binding protein [Candidatus Rokubacteria bacterium]
MIITRGDGKGSTGFLSLAVAILCLGWSVAVPGVVAGQGQPPPGGEAVYRRPLGHDPGTLDPARVRDIYGLSVTAQVFDGLVQFDRTLAITPALAQHWKASRDGLTWTFTLRRGVRFHDGNEITSDDVVYSITRLLDPKVNSVVAGLFTGIKGAGEFRDGRAARVAGLSAPDRYTVQVLLDDNSVPFVSLLSLGHAKIVPAAVIKHSGESFGQHPVGTGAFKFVRWERGKEIVLAANPGYFEGAPRLSGLVFRIFPGNQSDAMYEAFQRGHLEDSPPPSKNYGAAVGSKRHLYMKRPMLSLRFYGLNTRIKPLDDRRIRQALNYAIDQESLVEDVFLGRYAPARGVLPPGTLGFNPQLRGYPYDPPRARQLLKEAGYPGGNGLPVLQIWSSVKRDEIVRSHEHVQRYLAAVGIRCEFHYLTDWPAFSKLLAEGRLPIFLYGWYADVPDPDSFLFRLFYSKSLQNYTAFSNRSVDDLLLMARRQSELQPRVEMYRRAEQAILDEAPIIPILHHTYERLFQPYVRSVEVNGLGDPYIPLRKMWLDRRE